MTLETSTYDNEHPSECVEETPPETTNAASEAVSDNNIGRSPLDWRSLCGRLGKKNRHGKSRRLFVKSLPKSERDQTLHSTTSLQWQVLPAEVAAAEVAKKWAQSIAKLETLTVETLTASLPGNKAKTKTRRKLSKAGKKLTRKIETLRSQLASEVLEQVAQLDASAGSQSEALIGLAAAQSLRAIADACSADQWQRLVQRLLELSRSSEFNASAGPLTYQRLGIELPLTIVAELPGLENAEQLLQRVCLNMTKSIEELLDSDGWPHVSCLTVFGPLVASWVRASMLLKAQQFQLDHEAEMQLEWLVRQVTRMLRPDRTLVFGTADSPPVSDWFLRSLFSLTQDREDKRLLRFLLDRPNEIRKRLPEPSNISEWAEAALLQSSWLHSSAKVAVDFSDKNCRVEIAARTNLIAGRCLPKIAFNDQPLSFMSPFEVTCDESDEDVEYIELQCELSQSVMLSRQFLLCRSDAILLVADTVVAPTAGKFDYQCDWPLAPAVNGMHESETREVYLRQNKVESLVLPLALPEWQSADCRDRLEFTDGTMRLLQSTEPSSFGSNLASRGLCAPLLFDLCPKRSTKKRTWRQLTVAQNRKILTPSEGVAFRIQLNKQQWIFYRAVSQMGNRTFMGENFNGEFVFSRLDRNGKVTRLIEIGRV